MMLMGFRPDESHRCMDVKVKSKKRERELNSEQYLDGSNRAW